MDIAAILFLVFGWIFGVTGLKVASLVMSSIFFVIMFLLCIFMSGKFSHPSARVVEFAVIVALSIISLTI